MKSQATNCAGHRASRSTPRVPSDITHRLLRQSSPQPALLSATRLDQGRPNRNFASEFSCGVNRQPHGRPGTTRKSRCCADRPPKQPPAKQTRWCSRNLLPRRSRRGLVRDMPTRGLDRAVSPTATCAPATAAETSPRPAEKSSLKRFEPAKPHALERERLTATVFRVLDTCWLRTSTTSLDRQNSRPPRRPRWRSAPGDRGWRIGHRPQAIMARLDRQACDVIPREILLCAVCPVRQLGSIPDAAGRANRTRFLGSLVPGGSEKQGPV